MGCTKSKHDPIICTDDVSITASRYWQRILSPNEAKTNLIVEGSVNGTMNCEIEKSHLELRALLDYPIGREFIFQYLSSNSTAPFLITCYTGWLDIQYFDTMINGSDKKTMAYSILKKYIKDSDLFGKEACVEIETAVKAQQWNVSLVDTSRSSSPFKSAQSVFFKTLHDHMFVKFNNTLEYENMCANLRRKYNRVKQNDFWYHQLIGQGGFGLVAKVTKKSTGVQYAMKLQRKDHLMQVFGNEPWRVEMEKRAFASCRHPFIVELHFAFQTESLVAMVMSLGTGRDLSNILRNNGPLTIEQVTFYAAETTSVLSYLHDKGLVYRDLKPANILLDLDGHIRLIDFGAVSDVNGKLLEGNKTNKSVLISLEEDGTDADTKDPPLSQFWRHSSAAALPHHHTARSSDNAGDGNMLSEVSATEGPDLKRLHARAKFVAAYPRVMRKLKQRFHGMSDATLLRHSLACSFNFDKTVVHIEDCLLWRQMMFTFKDAPDYSSNSSGVGCFFYTHGFDVDGHPLLLTTPRLIANTTHKDRNLDELVRWWVYMLEVAIQRLPPHLEQFTILGNRFGMNNKLDLEFASRIFPIMDKYYPFRRHKLLVYPMSGGAKAVGGVLKFLASKQAGNIHFLESLEQLKMHVPNEYIPAELGGACNYEFNINDYPPPAHLETCGNGYMSQPVMGTRGSVEDIVDLALGGSSSESVQSMSSLDIMLNPTSGSAQQSDGLVSVRSWSHVRKVGDDSSADELHSSNNLEHGDGDGDGVDGTNHEGVIVTTRATRAKSIVGTHHYMAPEMIILMVDAKDTGFSHTGYTKAVDWWSLGVTIYRLLTTLYPFELDIPKPTTQEELETEGSDRYSALLQDVNYRMFGDNHPHVVDIISQLLTVDDTERLGYGPDGSNAVSAHKFFADINWVELEQKKSKPPPLPQGCEHRFAYNEKLNLKDLFRAYGKTDWLGFSGRNPSGPSPVVSSGVNGSNHDGDDISCAFDSNKSPRDKKTQAFEALLDRWDYTSAFAVLVELEAAAVKVSKSSNPVLHVNEIKIKSTRPTSSVNM